jgi:hypothetical protein
MSRRYKAGLVTASEPSSSGTPYTGAASGSWIRQRHSQSVFESAWPKATSVPGAPTSVQASAGNAQATVTFIAPTDTGGLSITSYVVTSNPGNITASGSSSPINITGLTNGTSYTFTVKAVNAAGSSASSGASNAITPTNVVTGESSYTTAGTYSWTCPSGVTSVSVVAVGAGGTGGAYGGSAGSLAYKNNIAVTPGQSYTVVVGATNAQVYASPYSFTAGSSSFGSSTPLVANGGFGGYSGDVSSPQIGSGYDGGGRGGAGSTDYYTAEYGYRSGQGGGAGGYTGNGGSGGFGPAAGGNGSGGGGGGGSSGPNNVTTGGGGVLLLGQGSNGAGGGFNAGTPGGGGSFGNNGSGVQGGLYGGASGGIGSIANSSNQGKNGAVRIIWGSGRAFPSTNTGVL